MVKTSKQTNCVKGLTTDVNFPLSLRVAFQTTIKSRTSLPIKSIKHSDFVVDGFLLKRRG
jgi:hypothetical protein